VPAFPWMTQRHERSSINLQSGRPRLQASDTPFHAPGGASEGSTPRSTAALAQRRSLRGRGEPGANGCRAGREAGKLPRTLPNSFGEARWSPHLGFSRASRCDGLVTATRALARRHRSRLRHPALCRQGRGRDRRGPFRWKGALGGMVEALVAAMQGLGAQRRNISAALGPTIASKAMSRAGVFQQIL